MGGTVLPDTKRFAISANFGTFRGENGFAPSAAVRINEFVVANAAIGTGLARGGVGGRVGATFAWFLLEKIGQLRTGATFGFLTLSGSGSLSSKP